MVEGTEQTAETQVGSEAVKTFTQAEVDALKSGLDRRVSELTKELQSKKGSDEAWRSELTKLREDVTQQVQLMAALVAEGRSPDEAREEIGDMTPKAKTDALKRVQQFQVEQEQKRQVEESRKVGESIRTRVEALGLKPTDKAYRDIWRDVRDGFAEAAEAELTELEIKKNETVKQPMESDEVKFAKRLEQEKQKWMEEKGLLTSETGGPSASFQDFQKIEADYIAGKISDAAYTEARKKRGLI